MTKSRDKAYGDIGLPRPIAQPTFPSFDLKRDEGSLLRPWPLGAQPKSAVGVDMRYRNRQPKRYKEGRRCANETCRCPLSQYNPDRFCGPCTIAKFNPLTLKEERENGGQDLEEEG